MSNFNIKKSNLHTITSTFHDRKLMKGMFTCTSILLCTSIFCSCASHKSVAITKDPSKTVSPIIVSNTENEIPVTTAKPTSITKFRKYKKSDVDSPYYSDPGKEPLTTVSEKYTTVKNSYFEDAIFIGDSLMRGFYEYLNLKKTADFYCEDGYSYYNWFLDTTITHMNTGKKESLSEVLAKKSYGKIYIMLALNDLGYGNTKIFDQRVSYILENVQKSQPDAIIYLMGGLHFSKERNKDEVDNNININDKNVVLANHADGEKIFYLDSNPLFTDKDGYQKDELSSDGCHVFGCYYKPWIKFLKQHAIED